MINGITIKILGDYGPFSKVGKSIGYQLTVRQSSYLIDCGSPPFLQIGDKTLKDIRGLIITHNHDDHKRWYTDIVLFYMYEKNISRKFSLLTSEDVYTELIRATGPALDRSLSNDSKNVIDISHDEYINYSMLGPRAKYTIMERDEGGGRTAMYIADRDGNILGPDKAKIIISKKTKRRRMLFKDTEYDEWVEPESFYPFSSNVFYEENKNIFIDKEGLTIEAIKAPVWHGITGIGLRIKTDTETVVFSSDTAHDKNLWKQLASEKRKQRITTSKKDFESAVVIYGDINDYIERAWSEERYREAIETFNDAVVIHDIASTNSIVHTDYNKLKDTCLNKEKTILTHSPDITTSEWILCGIEKTYQVIGGNLFEKVNNKLYTLDADVYHKEGEDYYVGYRSENGQYTLYEHNGLLTLGKSNNLNSGTPLFKVNLYEDIAGEYFPKIENEHAVYQKRRDGKVELIEFTDDGSKGKIVENHRVSLISTVSKLESW